MQRPRDDNFVPLPHLLPCFFMLLPHSFVFVFVFALFVFVCLCVRASLLFFTFFFLFFMLSYTFLSALQRLLHVFLHQSCVKSMEAASLSHHHPCSCGKEARRWVGWNCPLSVIAQSAALSCESVLFKYVRVYANIYLRMVWVSVCVCVGWWHGGTVACGMVAGKP